MKKRIVFAVHNWETCDDKHHVYWTATGNLNDGETEYFDDWDEALIWAFKKSIEIRAEEFQIDCPTHVHEMIIDNNL